MYVPSVITESPTPRQQACACPASAPCAETALRPRRCARSSRAPPPPAALAGHFLDVSKLSPSSSVPFTLQILPNSFRCRLPPSPFRASVTRLPVRADRGAQHAPPAATLSRPRPRQPAQGDAICISTGAMLSAVLRNPARKGKANVTCAFQGCCRRETCLPLGAG